MVTPRRDGPLSRRPIWVVVVDGEAYVRSYRGESGGWYRQARADGLATIGVDGRALEVGVEPVSDEETPRGSRSRCRRPVHTMWPISTDPSQPKARTRHGRCKMKAIVVTDQAAGTAGMTLVDRPEPPAAINDVIVQIHASGFVPTEMAWPSTWTDRRDRDRTPSIPGHELAGVVTALGYGTTGLSVGQRVLG